MQNLSLHYPTLLTDAAIVVRPMPMMPGLPSPGLPVGGETLSFAPLTQPPLDGNMLWGAVQNAQLPYDLVQPQAPQPIAIDPVDLANGSALLVDGAVVIVGTVTVDHIVQLV